MTDVTADNLTLDEATDDQPADAATDNMADESAYKGPSKRKSIDNAQSSAKRLKNTALMMKLK